jgi:hypothetical protein
MRELEIRRAVAGNSGTGFAGRRRVDRRLVVMPGIDGTVIDTRAVRRPVIGNLVVVEDVDPAEVLPDGRPVGRSINLAVLLPVVFGLLAPPLRPGSVIAFTDEFDRHE